MITSPVPTTSTLLKGDTIFLRPAEICDAPFILSLRLDPTLNTYLSPVTPDLNQQEAWLRTYKQRERLSQEFYFIVERHDGMPCGTVRLYNREARRCEWGSVILNKDRPAGAISQVMRLSLNFAFDELGLESVHLRVDRHNERAIKAYERFRWQRIANQGEELTFQFERSLRYWV